MLYVSNSKATEIQLEFTYEIVVLAAHSIGAASDVDNVNGGAVETNGYGGSVYSYAKGGEKGSARG